MEGQAGCCRSAPTNNEIGTWAACSPNFCWRQRYAIVSLLDKSSNKLQHIRWYIHLGHFINGPVPVGERLVQTSTPRPEHSRSIGTIILHICRGCNNQCRKEKQYLWNKFIFGCPGKFIRQLRVMVHDFYGISWAANMLQCPIKLQSLLLHHSLWGKAPIPYWETVPEIIQVLEANQPHPIQCCAHLCCLTSISMQQQMQCMPSRKRRVSELLLKAEIRYTSAMPLLSMMSFYIYERSLPKVQNL